MDVIEWAIDPWGTTVAVHIAWVLIWVAAIAGLAFVTVHAIWVRYFARPEEFADNPSPELAAALPARVPRHSGVARYFHWVMAASMFTLLFTAFLPKAGVEFDWVTYHWIAGMLLTASIFFHVIHASFWLDFWAIWPDRTDLQDAWRRMRRFAGLAASPPRRFAKYPLENKGYHAAIMATGLTAIGTGFFMIFRVETILPRNPYLFTDTTWGLIYVLHGLAGVGLIALVMVHVYFAIRPEKLDITKSMIFGSMNRDFYLEHYDSHRWKIEAQPRREAGRDPHSL